jgi:hypothetical protein
MSSKQINQLPSGTANSEAFVAADNAGLTETQKIKLGDIAKLATSADVSYDNATSNLSATNIKAALDELAPKKVRNATKDTYFDTIQAAIDDANDNDIITLAAGTYSEVLYIWKPLTLRGPNYDKRGDDPTRVPEAILEYASSIEAGSYMIYSDVDNVTLEGLDLRYPDSLLKAGHNAAVTFTDAGDLVTCNNHGFANGDTLMFSAKATTTGVSTYTNYYVVNAATNTFQLASAAGGSALPLTNNGTGTIFGAAGILWFSYARNNLVLRNNRWYSSEVPIYIYFNLAPNSNIFGNKTGGLIEGNYIDCGPFVNSNASGRAIYCADLAATIQDNVIVNSCIGIQVSPYSNPTASLIQRNTVSSSIVCLYSNVHHFGSATVTWKNNVGTLAPNDRSGLKARIAAPLTTTSNMSAIWIRSIAIDNSHTGANPSVVVTNNLIDLSLDPSKTYNNTTALRAIRFQDVRKVVTTTINNNSFVGWTVAARSDATNGLASASSIDANLANNWWGTAASSKLVVESTVVSGSITVSPVLSGRTTAGAILDYIDIASLVEVPASATAAGTAGQIAYDGSYIYICTATDVWRRVAIGSW